MPQDSRNKTWRKNPGICGYLLPFLQRRRLFDLKDFVFDRSDCPFLLVENLRSKFLSSPRSKSSGFRAPIDCIQPYIGFMAHITYPQALATSRLKLPTTHIAITIFLTTPSSISSTENKIDPPSPHDKNPPKSRGPRLCAKHKCFFFVNRDILRVERSL